MSSISHRLEPEKRTVVRFSLARAFARALQVLGTPRAARVLGWFLMRPPQKRSFGLDDGLRASARRFTVGHGHRAVAAWSWGTGPVVLLAHGWGGRGSQLGGFVRPLLAAGRRVVTYDAPGHGASGGSTSSVVDMARAIREIEQVTGSVDAVIAHSAGGAATTLALHDGLRSRRAVFVAPALRPGSFLQRIMRALRVPVDLMKETRARMESRVGRSFRDVHRHVATPVPGVALLVVHDRGDRVVPHADGERFAAGWPDAELVTTEGLGHSRIVEDEGVIGRAVAFVTG